MKLRPLPRGLTLAIGAVWLFSLAVICLTPHPGEVPGGVWGEWFPEHAGVANFLLNIFLFVPGGAVLGGITGAALLGLLGGALLSIGIETLQLWIPGRHTSFPDVVANSLGAWLGAYAIVRSRSWVNPRVGVSRILAIGWLLAAAVVLGSVGTMLTPTAPKVTLYSGWTPQLRALEAYNGQVLYARIGDLPFPNGGPIAAELQPHLKSLIRDVQQVELTFLTGPLSYSLAPILRIAGEDGDEALLIAADGTDLLIRRRYLSDDLRFARPELRVRQVLAGAPPGDTVRVLLARDSAGWDLVTVNEVPHRLGFTPARGWSLLRYPSGLPEGSLMALDTFWLLALALPFGWWASSLALVLLGSAGLVGILLWVPLLSGFVPGNSVQAMVIIAGGLAGWIVRRSTTCRPEAESG